MFTTIQAQQYEVYAFLRTQGVTFKDNKEQQDCISSLSESQKASLKDALLYMNNRFALGQSAGDKKVKLFLNRFFKYASPYLSYFVPPLKPKTNRGQILVDGELLPLDKTRSRFGLYA